MISHNWSPMKRLIWLRGSGITGGSATWSTISGNPVSFTAKAAPLRKLEVAFSPVQEGSGDPSPDNVRPIRGWDNIVLSQAGNYNLFDPDSPFHWVINTSYQKVESDASRSIIIPCSQGDKFTISCQRTESSTKAVLYVAFAGASGDILSRSGTSTNSTLTGTAPSGAEFCYVGVQTIASTAWVQVEKSATASEYVPYNGRSISISLGETVYSGTVDVVTGVVTVDMASVDLGTLSWTYGGTTDANAKRMLSEGIHSLIKPPATSGTLANMICENYKTITGNAVYTLNTGIGVNTMGDITIYDPNYNTAQSPAAFKTAMSGVQLVYELATPIPIQLTPQEVESLAGDNTMWSDANGDLTVEYRSN